MKNVKASLCLVFLIGSILSFIPAKSASAAPLFQMPFPCNQTWTGQTRTNHSPANSVDLNRTNDFGDTVVASAAGTAVTVRNLGNTSYGKYVVIDHGGGWKTYYAHLSAFSVNQGESVKKGEKIGEVGSTGNSTGSHLHYEQRYNGNDVQIKWNGSTIHYWGSKSYSSNNCSSKSGAPGTVNTNGADLNVRSGPGTGYSVAGQVADGESVTISCQTHGQTITGTYGTTDIWDKIGPGQYVSDAYIYTGSDGLVAPLCSN
ncbi:peptidoglycan DD-metalloendopeptidase family protein [Bacillus sp. NTK071]|uniref:peptidoglycan DD-metalloendopeptidase family protein n=1 Tax=Bacillus sp. NTK071 TaxID=2802175 RepID=UPI001A8D61B1|nr:peptidoglycan DD-metalloendopeptidase family protein [Bacillus sp. NTK071]MBN8208999.1 peptidoglycan DD-metalloendopeptidase family protein [Bacillus sp. NTK071]